MNTFEEYINNFFKNFTNDKEEKDINCLKRAINAFCETGNKEDAFVVYYCFSEIYKIFGTEYKDSMTKIVELLSDHEYHSGELINKHRDHYSHSVFVFVLGLSIYANNKKYRKEFNDYYKIKDNSNDKFLQLWGLTSLFHDIGYPFQLAHEQIKQYAKNVVLDGDTRPTVDYINFNDMLHLPADLCKYKDYELKDYTINELVAHNISETFGYDYEKVNNILKNRCSGTNEFMDHGYFSMLLVYYKFVKFDISSINDEILDVLTAITMHNNLQKYEFNSKKDGIRKPYNAEKHPLAFLLALCDEFQDWNRTAFGFISKKDSLPWNAELEINDKEVNVTYIFASDKKLGCNENDPTMLIEEDNKKYLDIVNGKKKNDLEFYFDLKLFDVNLNAEIKEKNLNTKRYSSSDNLINLCDFAVANHNSYRKICEKQGQKTLEFENIPLEQKVSNIEVAKHYNYVLELVNCFYSDKELDYPIVTKFSHEIKKDANGKEVARDDLGFLSREEHLRWVKEKIKNGWKYGKKRDDKNQLHPSLIPYDFLSPEEQIKDTAMVENMIPLLYNLGHGTRIYSYREGRKPTLNIACIGHRNIPHNEYDRLKEEIKTILLEYSKDYRVVVRTNFARGADQLFAKVANELELTLKIALPVKFDIFFKKMKDDAKKYDITITDEEIDDMRLQLAQAISTKVIDDPEYGYGEAAKYIINRSDKLIAIWDGIETKLIDDNNNPIHVGGTYYSIKMAKDSRGLGKSDIHIIKCNRTF